MRSHRRNRRSSGIIPLVGSLIAVLLTLTPPVAADPTAGERPAEDPGPATSTRDAAEGTEENLGQPITGLTNAGAGYTENADGRDIGLVVAGGSPSQFSAVDLVTG